MASLATLTFRLPDGTSYETVAASVAVEDVTKVVEAVSNHTLAYLTINLHNGDQVVLPGNLVEQCVILIHYIHGEAK